MKKLAIITSHPIQYNAPLFERLARNGNLKIKVFYTWGESVLNVKFDPGFAKIIQWDLPLFEGYDYAFVKNTSKKPGSHYFNGIINPTLIDEIEQWNADAILVFGWSFKSHLKAIRYFHNRIPVYFRGDSTLLDENQATLKKIIRKMSLKWIYHYIDIAFYVGQANKAYFKKFGLKEEQLKFAPHAVDNERFQIASTENLRTRLKIPEDAVVFLFSGKFENKKNPKILIEAFRQSYDPKAYLLLVGNGNLEQELKEMVKKFPDAIQNRIIFLDFQNQSEMPKIYQCSDIFVLPSSGPGETWGLSVNEAMAASLPVLVSDKCGCATDLVQENVNGFIFNANDIKSLISKMKLLLSKRHELMEMGNASQKIIGKWSFNHICQAIENALIIQ